MTGPTSRRACSAAPGPPFVEGGTLVHPTVSSVPQPRRSEDAAPPGGAEPGSVDPGCVGPAWIVREVTHVPGVLRLEQGRLLFVSSRGVVFDVAVAGLDVAPSWRDRGGFRIAVGDERLRVQVVRPAGAVEPGAVARRRPRPDGPGDVTADDRPAWYVEALATTAGLATTRGDGEAAGVWRTLLLSATDRSAGRRASRARRGSAGSTPRT